MQILSSFVLNKNHRKNCENRNVWQEYLQFFIATFIILNFIGLGQI